MNKKIISILLSMIILFSTSLCLNADKSIKENDEDLVIEYLIKVNEMYGVKMTRENIEDIRRQVSYNAEMMARKQNTSKETIYKQYLNEMKKSIGDKYLKNIKTNSKIRTIKKQLPISSIGDIFLAENGMGFNHVGLYTKYNEIVQSHPDHHGVRVYSIYNSNAWQTYLQGGKSCLLEVYSSKLNGIVAWAKQREYRPYDWDFLDNKSDSYYGYDSNGIFTAYPEDDAYNCSELVWKAYKKVVNIDLDGDGGLAVYPNDIKISSNTNIFKYW